MGELRAGCKAHFARKGDSLARARLGFLVLPGIVDCRESWTPARFMEIKIARMRPSPCMRGSARPFTDPRVLLSPCGLLFTVYCVRIAASSAKVIACCRRILPVARPIVGYSVFCVVFALRLR